MEFQEAKALIGKIFMVNADDHESVNDVIKYAEDRAASKEWARNRKNPDQEFRELAVTAMRVLANYADSVKLK